MKLEELERLRYFSINEKDYKGRFIFQNETVRKNTDIGTMRLLDDIREALGFQIRIHCAYELNGHKSQSWHKNKRGTAVDFHFKTDLSFVNQVNLLVDFLVERGHSMRCGLGIYPDWGKGRGGFHLDTRGFKARWGGVYETDDDGETVQVLKDFIKVLNYAAARG